MRKQFEKRNRACNEWLHENGLVIGSSKPAISIFRMAFNAGWAARKQAVDYAPQVTVSNPTLRV